MKVESPKIDQENILSMAACLMGKIDRLGFIAAWDKLADPNSTLLREKWLPIAETALEHFNFLQRPRKRQWPSTTPPTPEPPAS